MIEYKLCDIVQLTDHFRSRPIFFKDYRRSDGCYITTQLTNGTYTVVGFNFFHEEMTKDFKKIRVRSLTLFCHETYNIYNSCCSPIHDEENDSYHRLFDIVSRF